MIIDNLKNMISSFSRNKKCNVTNIGPQVGGNSEDPSVVRTFLEYYISLEKPGYAVMISGEWGSGKTLQVNRVIPENKRVNVSLFGLSSRDEIIASVFSDMYPLRSNLKKKVRNYKDAGLGIFGLDVPLGALISAGVEFIKENIDKDKIIIFDDLERCVMKGSDLFGVINHYIEKHGCRVVIICNESKVSDEFIEIKEKLVGRTMTLLPNVNEAFRAFSEEISKGHILEIIRHNQSIIVDIFEKSEAKSLRILRYVIEDLHRLLSAYSKDHIKNKGIINTSLKIAVVMITEAKLGRINATTLPTPANIFLEQKEHAKKLVNNPNAEDLPMTLHQRYRHVNFYENLFNEEALLSILIEGNFDKLIINRSISENYVKFAETTKTKTWRLALGFSENNDEDNKKIFSSLMEEFNQRKYEKEGDFMHMFCMLFLYKSIKNSEDILSQFERECKQYIDDLFLLGKIDPPRRNDVRLSRSFEGQAYWIDDQYFNNVSNIRQYLEDKKKEMAEKNIPRQCDFILSLLQEDPERLVRIIKNEEYEEDEEEIPEGIMMHIQHDAFFERWQKMDPRKNSHIIELLIDMGEGNSDRKTWMEGLMNYIQGKLSEMDDHVALKWRRYIKYIMYRLGR